MIRSQIASRPSASARPRGQTRFTRATTMPLLWALLTLALHLLPGAIVPTHGQGSRKDDIVFNSRGIPLAGATVRVCIMPASGQPCTPLAQIYSDAGLTQAIANPTTTDGLGNYFFYAAPGKYEIEVSGPGITTKQLPNVILPNDPSSPTFTGAVSAFSLSLGGNLNVTGNTTVVGSLASGTLNLSNQSTPPGAASSGTVNLYTKTADKRLYYKDDTGTEVGPISSASGAQTNIVNTFTATQNFDADIETKGPNPYFSLSRYGGYSSASAPSTTGTISSSSTTLTLANAQDFANGQGIMIYKAGPATTLTTPGQPTVTPINVLNGSTTYNYAAIAEDRSGGLTAASTVGTTTTGAATLGANTITLTQCQRTNGVATYTSSANHNLQAGAQVSIAGFTGGVFDFCNGVKTIASTPTGTTFTTNDGSAANETNTTGSPTAIVFACNTLTFPNGSFSGPGTIHYWIYRSTGGGSFSLVGVAQGMDPWWQDCGRPAPSANGYVPATPPSSAQPGYLATTIASGGGTTTLTLANAAGTSATSQVVLHDNSMPLKNAVQAATNANGGTVYIPNAGNQSWVFNATTDFNSGITFTVGVVRIHLNSSAVFLNNPWIVHSSMDFEGEPRTTSSFTYVNGSQMIAIGAYPLFLLPETGGGSSHYSRLVLVGNQPQQSVMYADEGQDGGGVAGIVWDDVTFIGSNGNTNPVVLKGGFDYFFNRGDCNGEAASFVPFSCLQLTNSSTAVTGGGPGQVPGRVKLRGLYFSGNAMDIDCLPNNQGIAPLDFQLDTTIFESATAPYLRLNCSTGQFGDVVLTDVVQADSVVGYGTPSIDSQNAGITSVLWSGGQVNNGSNPALIIASNNSGASLQVFNPPSFNYGNAPYTVLSGPFTYSTGAFASAGNGRSESLLAGPAAPTLALSSGGSVPTGTMNYVILWLDVDGNYTFASPAAAANVTSGNQTVTITIPSAPVGAVAWLPFRAPPASGPTLLNVNSLGSCGSVYASGIPLSTVSFVDSFSFTCGTTLPTGTPAGASILGPNGLSGPKIRLVNNGNILSTTFPNSLSANRTLSIPDNSGYLPVTGYVNSGYDNFNRANGGLGANWTTYSGLTAPAITGNQIVGNSGGSQSSIWNANSFAADQFAEITAAAASDGSANIDPGVRLTSGVGGYVCLANGASSSGIWKITGTSFASLASATVSYAAGDVLRCEIQGTTITFYKNGVSQVSVTDTTYSSGAPGFNVFGNSTGAAFDNWTGGNLHPLAQLDVEADWTKPQHFTQGVALGTETLTASPRAEQTVFLPGTLSSTWTGSTWTTDKAVTVTRVQVQAKTAPSGCSTNAVVRLTDGTSPVNVTITAAANDSGSIAQNYAAASSLTVSVQTAAAGCTTTPADANVVVQYRMQ